MKKYALLSLLALLVPVTAHAQLVDPTAETFPIDSALESVTANVDLGFEILNVSNGNQDATKVGLRPGDVVRYRMEVTSNDFDVVGLEPVVDINELLNVAELIDSGFATEANGILTYPPFSAVAPYDKDFAFFARVGGDCKNIDSITIRSMGEDIVVPLVCEKEAPVVVKGPLSKTGPTALWMLGLVAVLGGAYAMNRKQTV